MHEFNIELEPKKKAHHCHIYHGLMTFRGDFHQSKTYTICVIYNRHCTRTENSKLFQRNNDDDAHEIEVFTSLIRG